MPLTKARTAFLDFLVAKFAVGSRVVGMMSALILFSFSVVFLLRYADLIQTYPYRLFKFISSPMIWGGVMIVAMVQIMLMWVVNRCTSQIGAWVQMMTCLIFIFFSALFIGDKEALAPPNTAFWTYMIIAIFEFFSALVMMREGDLKEEQIKAQTNGS